MWRMVFPSSFLITVYSLTNADHIVICYMYGTIKVWSKINLHRLIPYKAQASFMRRTNIIRYFL